MKALQVKFHAKEASQINIDLIESQRPSLKEEECLIQVAASGINPSDALAAMGYFNHASLPRIPGRDFSGLVIEGPAHLLGKKVWGTGGAAGISFDGTQTEYVAFPVQALSEAPQNIDLVTAGAQVLPYVTAYYSLAHRAKIQAGEAVLIVGALGQVGQAAMSIAHWKGCLPIALVRGQEDVARAEKLGWKAVDSDDPNLTEKILAANQGKKIQVILNSLGNIYWQSFTQCLSEFGRIVTIGARENVRDAVVNLFELYRANQEIIGVNTVSFDFAENATLLNELRPGFESGHLKPLDLAEKIYTPEEASEAYQAVMKGTEKRIVIKFKD
ncbi:MAG: alcohol dehydrogenase zinc-binding domain protein [Gammaproteobacteria bacterium]|jgi:NADPH:quinone reductase-like Zn-dependent oxidoreductase|nr:alcohol dehydrogenase zinc-binding domain protein [Gammaproteobacteria bacterium]